jgi:hypothetical protein
VEEGDEEQSDLVPMIAAAAPVELVAARDPQAEPRERQAPVPAVPASLEKETALSLSTSEPHVVEHPRQGAVPVEQELPLIPSLFECQKSNLAFMRAAELDTREGKAQVLLPPAVLEGMRINGNRLEDALPRHMFQAEKERLDVRGTQNKVLSWEGVVLADKVGMGKTRQCVALIKGDRDLMRVRGEIGKFEVCGVDPATMSIDEKVCQVRVSTNATLIVCTNYLVAQV